MTNFVRRLFRLDQYTDRDRHRRALALGYIYLASLPGAVIGDIVTWVLEQADLISVPPHGYTGPIVYTILGLISVWALRNGRFALATRLFEINMFVTDLIIVLSYGITTPSVVFLAGGIVAVSMLATTAETFVFSALTIAHALIQAMAEMNGIYPAPRFTMNEERRTAMVVLPVLLGIVYVMVTYITSSLRGFIASAERYADRANGVVEVVKETSANADPDELLTRVADTMREHFGFHHVQIFLVDEDGVFAELKAATGRVGKALLSRGYKVAVGSESAVGQAAALGRNVSLRIDERLPATGEVSPEARAELAIPLRVDEHIIGVLDVQCTNEDAFDEDTTAMVGVVASFLSGALNNIQLVEKLREQAEENARLAQNVRERAEEIERLNRQLLGRGWETYLASFPGGVLGFDWDGHEVHLTTGLSKEMGDAWKTDTVRWREEDGRAVLTVPLKFGGMRLGVMEFVIGEGAREEDTATLAQTVAERVAMALENARLFGRAQRMVRHEREVTEFTAALQRFYEVETLLKVAAEELRDHLDSPRVSLRIGVLPPSEQTDNDGGGGETL